MRTSLILTLCLVAGWAAGAADLLPAALRASGVEVYCLYVLLFFVGLGVGGDSASLRRFVRVSWRGLVLPLAIAAGSILGGGAAGLLLAAFGSGVGGVQGMAVGAGFGYYSLSSVLIAQLGNPQLAAVALLSNVLREVLTLIGAPLLARLFGPLGPIAAGGATNMDTTLPVISRQVDAAHVVLAVVSGIVLTLLVPFVVPLFF